MATTNKINQALVIDDVEIIPADDSIFDDVMQHTNLMLSEDAGTTKEGISFLLQQMLEKEESAGESLRVNRQLIDETINKIDSLISQQLDEILHHEDFQSLESVWREVEFLVDRVDFNENIEIKLLSASKQELKDDLEDAVDIYETGLYHHVYVSEYGQFGGHPYTAIISAFDFNSTDSDVDMLAQLSNISAVAHAPFIANISPQFFGAQSFEEVMHLKDFKSIFESPKYRRWNALRDSVDARHLGLAMPRFMLRTPYGANRPVRSFNYHEAGSKKNTNYLWGHASIAIATRLADSFARYRWCPNIIGPKSGGAIEDLPSDLVEINGKMEIFGPVEATISDRKEYELSELGFIPFSLRKNSEEAAFFSAPSIQLPRNFGNDEEGKKLTLDYRLGTQLPYLFVINRLAHYLKVLQRENLGSWKSRSEIEEELNRWLRQYIVNQDNPSTAIRSQRPLRFAKLSVESSSDEAGWYNVKLEVSPHFKFMGANFTLSLTGIMDQS